VCGLCSKEDWEGGKLPDKKDVATKMEYRGANRDQTLGNWMRDERELLINKHKHSTHRYRQVAKEILERRYSRRSDSM
jgi:hypothetical protein